VESSQFGDQAKHPLTPYNKNKTLASLSLSCQLPTLSPSSSFRKTIFYCYCNSTIGQKNLTICCHPKVNTSALPEVAEVFPSPENYKN